MTDTYDYIIIGAGSAGCVLANRLSEDPATKVLVLEYGGSDKSIFIQMPTALSIPMNGTKYNWKYMTLPEPGLDGRRVHCPRGKVIGGSSSINGLVYMRGHARDFDEWEERGARGWRYANCLPYFQRAESWQDGGDAYRGASGPLATNAGNRMQNPLYRAFVDAAARPATSPRRPERPYAGRLRADAHDGEGRRALVDSQRLSEAGDEPAEPHGHNPRHDASRDP